MFDSDVISRFKLMSDSEKISVLRQLLFSGMGMADYMVGSALVLAPERLEEIAERAAECAANPSPLPPVFPSGKPRKPA